MYGKIFSDIWDSSITQYDGDVIYVFIALITLADSEGYVRINPIALANRIKKPIEITTKALEILQQPDPSSKNPKYKGKRIIPLKELTNGKENRGWWIVTYTEWREIARRIDQTGKTKQRVQTYRKKHLMPANPVTVVTERYKALQSVTERYKALQGVTITGEKDKEEVLGTSTNTSTNTSTDPSTGTSTNTSTGTSTGTGTSTKEKDKEEVPSTNTKEKDRANFPKTTSSPGSPTPIPNPSPISSGLESFNLKPGISKVKKTKETDPRIRQVIDFFFGMCQKHHGVKPIIDRADAGRVKAGLKKLSPEQCKGLIVWFLLSKKCKEWGPTIKVCFSTNSINLWKMQGETQNIEDMVIRS